MSLGGRALSKQRLSVPLRPLFESWLLLVTNPTFSDDETVAKMGHPDLGWSPFNLYQDLGMGQSGNLYWSRFSFVSCIHPVCFYSAA